MKIESGIVPFVPSGSNFNRRAGPEETVMLQNVGVNAPLRCGDYRNITFDKAGSIVGIEVNALGAAMSMINLRTHRTRFSDCTT